MLKNMIDLSVAPALSVIPAPLVIPAPSVVPAQAGTHAVFDKSSVVPAKAGTYSSSVVPAKAGTLNQEPVVPAKAGTSGPPSSHPKDNAFGDPDSEGRQIEPFPGGKYLALRITDPFTAPFERIPQGWQTLVKYIKDNNIKVEWCKPGSCLEEVKEIDSVCYMDLLVMR